MSKATYTRAERHEAVQALCEDYWAELVRDDYRHGDSRFLGTLGRLIEARDWSWCIYPDGEGGVWCEVLGPASTEGEGDEAVEMRTCIARCIVTDGDLAGGLAMSFYRALSGLPLYEEVSEWEYEPNREALAMEARVEPEGRWGDE